MPGVIDVALPSVRLRHSYVDKIWLDDVRSVDSIIAAFELLYKSSNGSRGWLVPVYGRFRYASRVVDITISRAT